ncbi:YwqG family protein [Sphingobacterium hotanense]|uniref:YwqG family protein n=1 Tax=Sphingobacterium hotanense TaxID=649196 RepID=UPI0021A6E44C|nr:YwqG family protein [Sphingobacterium hotanense]MCT1523176.1 YwqG family protein [Sphingobacterium hotanense]
MDQKEQIFEIICFTADSREYYPASMEHENWMPENFVKHTDIDVALGQSRYGGPIVDLPPGVEHPENLRFAAQLDLSKFSPFDKSGLLPKKGQLIFFAEILNDTGKVIYADVANEKLVRITKEHEDNFYTGILIDQIYADTETFAERYYEPDDEDEETNEDGLVWGYFSGSEKSKIFGIYTNCQLQDEEIKEITFSDKVVLLQIGENGFNDEGVFSVLIPKEDLKNLNFDNCEFVWAQS